MSIGFRKWTGLIFFATVASRSYFVQEILVAFLLFATGFFVVALPIVGFFLLVDLCSMAVTRAWYRPVLEDGSIRTATRE